jgi:hypothetical protein
MPIEVKVDKEINSSEIAGHKFRIPTISRDGDFYRLNNLQLPTNWDKNHYLFKRVDLQYFCDSLNKDEYGDKLDGKLLYDKDTNLITEISLKNSRGQLSRVSLDQSENYYRNGYYRGEDIDRLSTAIVYQQILSRYLSVSGVDYAYISGNSRDYCSIDLKVPENIFKSKNKPITSDLIQDRFYSKAVYISGQFSTNLNYIKYDKMGIPRLIQIDSDDCHYINDGFFGYCAHNVDTPFQAATLHGIVAEFLNDIISREEFRNKE